MSRSNAEISSFKAFLKNGRKTMTQRVMVMATSPDTLTHRTRSPGHCFEDVHRVFSEECTWKKIITRRIMVALFVQTFRDFFEENFLKNFSLKDCCVFWGVESECFL